MNHQRQRTPDYILIITLLLYFIGYPLQSYLKRPDIIKQKTEESSVQDSACPDESTLPQKHQGH
jgi:hypothetical protein